MSLETLLETDLVTLQYHTEDKILHHTFHENVSGEALREMLNTGTEHIIKTGATKWLSDNRKYQELSQDDINFGLTDWGPRTINAGWKFWAMVVPEAAKGRSTLRHVVEAYHQLGLHVAVFTELSEAYEWLRKQQP